MEIANQLAEFFKHCLNVNGGARPENYEPNFSCGCECNYGKNPILWTGWMRIKFNPYLKDGKITDYDDNYVENLVYTLQDYKEYNACFGEYPEADKKINFLISKLNQDNIQKIIEDNSKLFPSEEEANTVLIFVETFNPALIAKTMEKLLEELHECKLQEHHISNQ